MKNYVFVIMLSFAMTYTHAQMTASFDTTINNLCQGVDCDWDGPSILINEIMLSPTIGDGSISGDAVSGGRGEWIELYNPDICNPVDISCYYLGNSARVSTGSAGGGFQIPAGTIVPPGGFCLVRGVNAPPVPTANLVANGGNTIEIIVPANITDDGVCVGPEEGGFFPMPATRLWFPNAGGWFAFYDSTGEPQDAISWGDEAGKNREPCIPVHSSCNTGVTSLASYNDIPNEQRAKVWNGAIPDAWDQTIRRVPDGGDWALNEGEPNFTYGDCNDICAELGSSTCDGTATINVAGGSGNYTYLWDDSETQMTQTATGLCEGTYTVTVTDTDTGISQTFTVEIEDLVLTFESSSLPSACGNNTGSIAFVAGNGESPYTYSVDGGTTLSGDNPVTGLSSGAYNLLIKDANGCIGEGTEIINDEGGMTIDELTLQHPNCIDDCDGVATVSLSAGGTPPYTYTWFDGNGEELNETGSTLSGLCVGNYSVSVVDANGCTAAEAFSIDAAEPSDATFALTDYCEGAQNAASDVASAGGVFELTSPLGDGATINASTGSISNGVAGTTYTVEYTTTGGCSSSIETVTVNAIPDVSFTASPMEGNPPLDVDFVNTSSGADNYNWNFGDGSSENTNDITLFHTYEDAGSFNVVLTGTTDAGCSDTATVQIVVAYPGMDYEFPNVFTPNGDGQNDLFKLVYNENIAYIEVIILNRWGVVLYEYEGEDINQFGWNGKVKNNGADCTEGTYFYKAEFTSLDGNKVKEHGFLHLSRSK